MNTMWKTGAQAGLVLVAGGALLLTGGIASAAPGEAHAECSVVQLPGVDLQLGQPGSCLSVLLPPGTTASPPAPAPAASTTPRRAGRRGDAGGAGRRRATGPGRRRQPAGPVRCAGPGAEPALSVPGCAGAWHADQHRRRQPTHPVFRRAGALIGR